MLTGAKLDNTSGKVKGLEGTKVPLEMGRKRKEIWDDVRGQWLKAG